MTDDRNGYSVGVEYARPNGSVDVFIFHNPLRMWSDGNVVFISTLDKIEGLLLSSVRNIYRLN